MSDYLECERDPERLARHKPGSYFFSVRSLVQSATTNVHVRWNNKTYVLELQDSATPLLSLVFKYATDTAITGTPTGGRTIFPPRTTLSSCSLRLMRRR